MKITIRLNYLIFVKMNQKNKVFHGCFTKNRDGTNRLIIRSEKCLTPTDKPFWKNPEDITSFTKTRSREKEPKKSNKTRV